MRRKASSKWDGRTAKRMVPTKVGPRTPKRPARMESSRLRKDERSIRSIIPLQRFLQPFADNPTGINFLCLGGEGNLTTASCGCPMFDYAVRLNASVYMLEHRFYGYSRPFP